MYKCFNGWTKEKMKEQIKKYNNGFRATNNFDSCLYKTEENNRCAVGCFIPNDEIEYVKEHVGDAEDLIKNYPDLEYHMPIETKGLLEMQKIHDYRNSIGDMREILCHWIDKNCEDS